MDDTEVLTARVPHDLAEKVAQYATKCDKSADWVVAHALKAWIAREDDRHQAIREGLADVDAGRVVDASEVLAWADGLIDDETLLAKR